MVCDVCLVRTDIVTGQIGHKLRNPLAFVHGALNLLAAQRMSKPALISFSEGEDRPPQARARSQSAWPGYHRR
jgi:hypothetical protein